jgi:hypothetical protein
MKQTIEMAKRICMCRSKNTKVQTLVHLIPNRTKIYANSNTCPDKAKAFQAKDDKGLLLRPVNSPKRALAPV